MNGYNNGISFDNGGFDLIGVWVNHKTGDKIAIKDHFIEDNAIQVMTTTGRILRYDQIQQYTKVSSNLKDLNSIQTPKPVSKITQNAHKPLVEFDENGNMMPPKQSSLNDVVVSNKNVPGFGDVNVVTLPHIVPNTPQQPMNSAVLEALRNLPEEEKPVISVDLTWDNKDEVVNVLTKYFNASREEICAGIFALFCDTHTMEDLIKDKLSKILGIEDPAPPTEKTTPKKKGGKGKEKEPK